VGIRGERQFVVVCIASRSLFSQDINTSNKANIAGVLTFDEARRIAVNVAKLPEVLGAVLKAEEASP
jgi:hypothetical protein